MKSDEIIISCGIVPVRFDNGVPRFLLLRSWNFWDFCKGRNEPGESQFETALREAEEEASLSPTDLDFKWGRDSYTTEPYKGFQGRKIGRYFVAETTKEDITLYVNPELGKPEHDSFTWATYAEAKILVNNRIGKVLQWASRKVSEKREG